MPAVRRVRILVEVQMAESKHVMSVSRPVHFSGNPKQREQILAEVLAGVGSDVIRALGPEVLRNE